MKQSRKNTRNAQRYTNRTCPAYPNAAEPSYFTGKAIEILTASVSGFGVVTAMLFLLVIS